MTRPRLHLTVTVQPEKIQLPIVEQPSQKIHLPIVEQPSQGLSYVCLYVNV